MTTDDNSVIIEPEQQASEESQKEAARTKRSKKIGKFYRWQIVLVVVIAVVAVSGLGFYKWHESPSFCDAICHTPQDPYNPTYFAEPGQPATDKWGNSVANARGGRVYNTACVFDRNGELLCAYDKTHLFTPMGEDDYYTCGDHLCCFTLDGVKCGIIICYDVRFPELTRSLALQGLDMLFVVSQ